MITLGYNVREFRTLQGLSKRELGERCGVTEWAIRDIEAQRGTPSMALLVNLRRSFDVTYDELVGDTDLMTREQLEHAIELVNEALARDQKTAKRDLDVLIERLHELDRLDAPQPAPAPRRRQLQLPVEPRASTRRR